MHARTNSMHSGDQFHGHWGPIPCTLGSIPCILGTNSMRSRTIPYTLRTNSMRAGDQFHAHREPIHACWGPIPCMLETISMHPCVVIVLSYKCSCAVQDNEPELEETFLINITSAYLISYPSIRLPLCNASNTSSSAAQVFINPNDHSHGVINFASDRRENACKQVTF